MASMEDHLSLNYMYQENTLPASYNSVHKIISKFSGSTLLNICKWLLNIQVLNAVHLYSITHKAASIKEDDGFVVSKM